MDVSSIRPFCHLCKYAVQAYIYTNTIVDIESNMVFRGASVGVIRDIISEYRDATDKYDEAMMELRGAAIYEPNRLIGILRHCVPTR